MREIKFRAWNRNTNKMWWFNPLWGNCYNQGAGYVGMLPIGKQMEHIGGFTGHDNRVMIDPDDCELMQYTGLKDKNGLTDIYEFDIIDECGNVVGNAFENSEVLNEVDKGSTHLIIPEITGKDWVKTYNEAILRGCRHP